MGQSSSSSATNFTSIPQLTTTPYHSDPTDQLPDECLSYIFLFVGQSDRKNCSLVSRRWLRVEGQTRKRLSLNAQSEIAASLPSLFTRFDSVSKLSLRCTRTHTSLNDDALLLIALRCRTLTRLKLRGCRQISDLGISEFAKHCNNKTLKKLSFGLCAFGASGMNAVLDYCYNLEEISIKRLRGIVDGADKIGPGIAKLKSICLKELVNGQCFEPMVMGAKNLECLRLIKCLGDWDSVVGGLGEGCSHSGLIEVHLERIQVSDLGLFGIAKCVNLEVLHVVKAPECSNLGVARVAESCRKLRKLHIDGWGTRRIGDEGLFSVANNCGNLQELVLIGVHATQFSLSVIAANCLRLERLALCGSAHIGDAEIACVASKCVALKKLCIKGCSISDNAIEALSLGCPNLVKIKVKKCKGVSIEAVDWLQERKMGLVVNFDVCEIDGMDGSSSDVGGQESGVEFPGGGQVVAAGPSSNGVAGRARLALAWAKLGVFAGRNLVTCAYSRWSNTED